MIRCTLVLSYAVSLINFPYGRQFCSFVFSTI